MSMLSNAIDTDQANDYVRRGWAGAGDLVVWSKTGALYKVTGSTSKKYKAMNSDGRDWMLPFGGCEAAPVGAVFAGPEKSRNQERQEQIAAKADELGVGMVVEVTDSKNPWPGEYLITKRTSATRFKIQQIGGYREGTAPASMLRKIR